MTQTLTDSTVAVTDIQITNDNEKLIVGRTQLANIYTFNTGAELFGTTPEIIDTGDSSPTYVSMTNDKSFLAVSCHGCQEVKIYENMDFTTAAQTIDIAEDANAVDLT